MKQDRVTRFNALFTANYPSLCRLAYGYLQDSGACEDIVQDVMVSIWERQMDRLEPQAFGAYARTAVMNSCVNQLRRRAAAQVMPLNEEVAAAHEAEEPEAAAHADYPELLDQVLGAMPPKCRQVFVMSKLEKVKYKEIAARLDISEKTVENHMGKALRIIRSFRASTVLLLCLLWVSISYIKSHM